MPPPHTALSLILVLLVLLLAPPRSQGSTTRHQSAKPAIATATAPRLRQGSRLIPGNPPATSHEKTSPGGPLHTSGPGSGARSRPRFTYTPAEEALQLYFNTTVALVSPSLKGYPEKKPRNIVYSKDMYITAD